MLLGAFVIAFPEPREAERSQAACLLDRLPIERREVHTAVERGELVPHLELLEHAQELVAAQFVALAVAGAEARQLDHVFREVDRVVDAADVAETLHEPAIVVGEVVDLIGHDPRRDRLCVIDARRSFLLPRGIRITLELRECVPRHVPHVCDARRGLPAAPRGRRRSLVPRGVVPQVDEIVMRARVHRRGGEDLLRECIDGLAARNRNAVVLVVPNLENQKRFSFEIVGKLVAELLERLHQRLAPRLFVELCLRVIARPRADPELLAAARLALQRVGFLDEILGAFLVVDVRHRHAPERHRAVRIEHRGLPE